MIPGAWDNADFTRIWTRNASSAHSVIVEATKPKLDNLLGKKDQAPVPL